VNTKLLTIVWVRLDWVWLDRVWWHVFEARWTSWLTFRPRYILRSLCRTPVEIMFGIFNDFLHLCMYCHETTWRPMDLQLQHWHCVCVGSRLEYSYKVKEMAHHGKRGWFGAVGWQRSRKLQHFT
jgi:hypothetical protein